jgi:predicted NACHT family NTPase
MGRKSLQSSEEGIKVIKKALKLKKVGQTYLAGVVGCSRQTIWSLLQGNPIDDEVFMAVCTELGLQWEDIAQSETLKPAPAEGSNLDELVQQARETVAPLIQERCGTMRVLDMSQPIDLGAIYTHVNILEKITGRKHLELADLLQEVQPDEFERFSLGTIKEKRIPGLDAVENHHKLMILGKPGAGKTTFLKHLAIECIGGAFQPHCVPIFITLKDFAETDDRPNLLAFIHGLLHLPRPVGVGNAQIQSSTLQIFENGRALILLDGLDEVHEADISRVLKQIQQFADLYPHNVFVITCRIAAREYIFQQFTEVEVADFDDAQIANVSSKWFRAKQDEVKATRFLEQLDHNPPIRDLASSPLLLTLLCLVFEDSGDFPTSRAELYQAGVDVLLKKWDTKRNIERYQVYKKLSLKRKEDLLSQIAWRTFAAGNYFFKQKDIEQQIREFIEHLPGASNDEETLNLDSEAVLKSIEAQHGLFVERARGIYSFSHLTFHEYFAAQEAKEKVYLTPLTEHLTERRWREVILLTVSMLPGADSLLSAMQQTIDSLLVGEETLQQVLGWAQQKADSVHTPYKPAAIRAFYLALALNLDHAVYFTLDRDIDINIDLDLDLDLDLDHAIALALHRGHILALDHTQIHEDGHALALAHGLARDLDHAQNLARDLSLILALDNHSDLQLKLEKLSALLPDTGNTWNAQHKWWQDQGTAWIEQLRTVMIEHRNIGHDWQLSEAQTQRLQQYYEANKLLVDCLNSDCYVSRTVREEIEATLLLPLAEIERRRTS